MNIQTTLRANSNQIINDDEVVLGGSRIDTLTVFEAFVIFINYMQGVAVVQNFRFYRCGMLIATLVNIFWAVVTYYASKLLIYAMNFRKQIKLEVLWLDAGFKIKYLVNLCIFLPSVSFPAMYWITIEMYIKQILEAWHPNKDYWYADKYVIGLIVIAFIMIPVISSQSFKLIYYISIIGSLTMIGVLALSVYWFGKGLYLNGFDPNNQIVVADFGNGFFDCVSTYIACYFTYLVLSTILNQCQLITLNKSKSILKASIIYYFVFIQVISMLQYFTVYNIEGTNDLFSFIPITDITTVVAMVLLMLKFICGMSISIYPAVETVLSMIIVRDQYPKSIWFCMGVLCLLATLMVASIAGRALDIMRYITNVLVLFMQYVYPTMVVGKFLKSMGIGYFIIGVLIALLGVGMSFFQIYTMFTEVL